MSFALLTADPQAIYPARTLAALPKLIPHTHQDIHPEIAWSRNSHLPTTRRRSLRPRPTIHTTCHSPTGPRSDFSEILLSAEAALRHGRNLRSETPRSMSCYPAPSPCMRAKGLDKEELPP